MDFWNVCCCISCQYLRVLSPSKSVRVFVDLVDNFEHLLAINSDDVYIYYLVVLIRSESRFESILGFAQMIQNLTQNNNIIDKYLINLPDLFTIQAMQSLVKTKHKAVWTNYDKQLMTLNLLISATL